MQKGNPHRRTSTGAGTHTRMHTRTGRGKVLHINVMPSISAVKIREREKEWDSGKEWERGNCSWQRQIPLQKEQVIATTTARNMQAHVAPYQPSPFPNRSLSLSLPPHNSCSLRNEALFCCCVCVLNDILYACTLRVCVCMCECGPQVLSMLLITNVA